MKRNYSDEEIINAVKSSTSIAQVLEKIGKKLTGGNYTHIKGLIRNLGISTDHFAGQAHLKGKSHSWNKVIPLEQLLVKNSSYPATRLKDRLVKAGLLKYECSKCGITDWCGEKLVLHLDHINGDHFDCRIENLRILCPNCHSLTPTYSNNKNYSKSNSAHDRT